MKLLLKRVRVTNNKKKSKCNISSNHEFFFNSIFKGLHKAYAKCMYTALNEKIEQSSKWFHFAIKLTVVLVIVPNLLISYINYFVYDLKEDSFILACPMMWVLKKRIYRSLSQKFQIELSPTDSKNIRVYNYS